MKASLLRGIRTIVSHADCPDGIASALILKGALPDTRVIFVEHGTPEYQSLEAEPHMLFCDIVPPSARADAFRAAEAIVLDHHQAARDLILSFGERGVFADENEEPGVSGALLAYREVWVPLQGDDDGTQRFAELAGVRDTWQTASPDWERSCVQSAALLFYGFAGLKNAALTDEQLAVGERLVAKRRTTAKLTAKKKWFRMTDEVAIYNDRDRLLSDVAQLIFEQHPAIGLVCGFHYKVTSDGKMLLVFAMRGRKDGVDVAAIAKAHGGGGHTSAAGFSQRVTADSPNPIDAFRMAVGN